MLKLRSLGIVGLVVGLLGGWMPVVPALGDGLIIIERPPENVTRPMPPRALHFPLEVKNHVVTCSINDTVGVTKVDQTFHNPNPQQLEGTYMFPLPETAAVQKFSMWMNGKEVHGELLDADKARQIYEDIVRRTKDPGLLEYVGQRLYRARVFPIPGNGDVRVALEYSETIAVNDGQAAYRYPLNTEKYSAKPIESVAIAVNIKSAVPITNVFCPSHTTSISRPNDKEARLGFEARGVTPDKDFIVNYLMSDKEFGLSLLSTKPPAEDGFCLVRISPPFSVSSDKIMPKDVCLVLDTSGSMAGEKIKQAKKALLFCLSSLHQEDRFNLITFSTDIRSFRDSLVGATSENIASAKAAVEKIEAVGGTAIDEALRTALKTDAPRSGERPFMVIFVTDGEPTVGEREPDKILANVKAVNQNKSRLFVFGVGHDLNAKLLDRLGDDNNGTRDYIDEKEDIEVKISAFYKKISDPVLSDIELKFGEAGSFDVYPKTLPDLFHGSELVLAARYRGPGRHSLVLTGKRGGENMTWTFPATFADSETEHNFLPRLWATRKIGYLMDEIRLHGEKGELKDEIVRLAKRYAIITPYTSYLVVEDSEMRLASGGVPLDNLSVVMRQRANADDSFADGLRKGAAYGRAVSGPLSVDASSEALSLREAPAAPSVSSTYWGMAADGRPDGHKDILIREVGSKTFYRDTNGRWVDSEYDGKAETRKVQGFSDEYFALLKKTPELGKYLALGQKLVVVLNKAVYEIQ